MAWIRKGTLVAAAVFLAVLGKANTYGHGRWLGISIRGPEDVWPDRLRWGCGDRGIAGSFGNAIAYEGTTHSSLKFAMIAYGVLAISRHPSCGYRTCVA
jgi:hypothetical protein